MTVLYMVRDLVTFSYFLLLVSHVSTLHLCFYLLRLGHVTYYSTSIRVRHQETWDDYPGVAVTGIKRKDYQCGKGRS